MRYFTILATILIEDKETKEPAVLGWHINIESPKFPNQKQILQSLQEDFSKDNKLLRQVNLTQILELSKEDFDSWTAKEETEK